MGKIFKKYAHQPRSNINVNSEEKIMIKSSNTDGQSFETALVITEAENHVEAKIFILKVSKGREPEEKNWA